VRKEGSFIYEDFMPTDGTDVKVYTVGPDYAHAEARKSPALDGKVERDKDGKEVRYPVILSAKEKAIARQVCLAFKQNVCGFDLLRANGKSYVCDVNGFSFVKNSQKYYDDCAKVLGNIVLRKLAPTYAPWDSVFPGAETIPVPGPIPGPSPGTSAMELRCVVAVIRHGDRTPKQKMKMEVSHPEFFNIFRKYKGFVSGKIKLKKPRQLQEVLDVSRLLLEELEKGSQTEIIQEKRSKLEQLRTVLEMYGHFSGINRKIQMKLINDKDKPDTAKNLLLIVKWGGELTPAGRVQAEQLGRAFRCMYPGGQGDYAGFPGCGLLRLHSTYRHDLKIYASDEGRVQMTAAAFAKGLLALEGELAPILVQMVKSANTNGLLDNESDELHEFAGEVKHRLHEMISSRQTPDSEFLERLIPTASLSMKHAIDQIQKPLGEMLDKLYEYVKTFVAEIKQIIEENDDKGRLYQNESLDLMLERWAKLERDLKNKKKGSFDVSKIPDVYDSVKYDSQHNGNLALPVMDELYETAKLLADIVIPQEYGITKDEKLNISHGYCVPLLRKILADLQANVVNPDESSNRLDPSYSKGVLSPGRHVRTRLYFTSESHIHSLLTILRYGGLCGGDDEQWARALDYISRVSELNYMTQIVIMLYEDPNKPVDAPDRFHIELHFSPGAKAHKEDSYPQGSGFRPSSKPNSRDSSPGETSTRTDSQTIEQRADAPQFSIQMRGLESRSRDLPGSPRDRSPEWNFSSEAKTPEQGVTQSDDDLEDVQSAAVRNFLKSSKPHRSAPVSDTNGDSSKRHSTGRTGPSGLGIFSRGNFFAKTFLSKNTSSANSLPNLNQPEEDGKNM